MGIGVQVSHGVGRQRDVEAELIGLACGDLDAIADGDADDDDLPSPTPSNELQDQAPGVCFVTTWSCD